MNIWQKYKTHIFSRCINQHEDKTLPYWRERVFAHLIIYVLPLSLITLIPGIPLAYYSGFYGMVFMDIAAPIILLFIAFSKKLSLIRRKQLFVGVIYFAAITLLYYMGTYGPALLFLLSAVLLSALIFETRYVFIAPHANVAVCIIYAVLIYFNWAEPYVLLKESPVIGWIGVAANLVFLGYVFAFLIPLLFEGLQKNIDQKSRLQLELEQEHLKLEKSMDLLKSKNSELEQYAYITSHDLQEPLRMVTSFLELLDAKYNAQLDEKAKQYIHYAVDGAYRMKALILDLLKYSRIESMELETEEFSLKDIVEEVILLFKEKQEEGVLTFEVKDLPIVRGNRSTIQQLIQNLVSNAVKFVKKGKTQTISIYAEDKHDYWKTYIRDQGIGIHAQYYERIFEVFKRLHSKNEYEGTGIGLAICKKIVEKHGGDIGVESVYGEGSTFYFTLKK